MRIIPTSFILTSQQRDEDLVIGMEAGADDYIIKPFKHNELRVAGRQQFILQLDDSPAGAESPSYQLSVNRLN